MKKHWITILLAATVTTLTVVLVALNKRFTKVTHEIVENFKKDSISISEMSTTIELMYKNCDFQVDKYMKLINENGDTFLLKEIIFDEYLLVARFSEFNCMSCITKEMQQVSNFINSHQNVICLAAYTKLSDLNNIKRLLNIPFEVYNVSFLSLIMKWSKKNYPIIFYWIKIIR